MRVPTTIDVSAYYRVAPSIRSDAAKVAPVVEREASTQEKSAQKSTLDYNQAVEKVRELNPVNIHPKQAAAIDTFLSIAYYAGGESIINTYA